MRNDFFFFVLSFSFGLLFCLFCCYVCYFICFFRCVVHSTHVIDIWGNHIFHRMDYYYYTSHFWNGRYSFYFLFMRNKWTKKNVVQCHFGCEASAISCKNCCVWFNWVRKIVIFQFSNLMNLCEYFLCVWPRNSIGLWFFFYSSYIKMIGVPFFALRKCEKWRIIHVLPPPPHQQQ